MSPSSTIIDPEDAAESAGLIHVSDDMPGITRHRAGKGFSYRDARGRTIRDAAERRRIAALAIPPAWTEVWICPDPRGHLLATGRDGRGRKQYRYHPDFREVRDSAKYERMLDFARALPRLRARVDSDMGLSGTPPEKVLATIVHLLENTMIRVGNDSYARENRSHGLTTLRGRHVRLTGSSMRFRFRGKGGKQWDLGLRDRRVARIIRRLQDLPGQHLFQYTDDEGQIRPVSSTEVNLYLRDVTGKAITAKDFRTWTGTVLAALALAEAEAVQGDAARQRNIRDAIESVAARLGNTPAICRKCYVHPGVIEAYLADELKLDLRRRIDDNLDKPGLRPEERQVMRLLRRRLTHEQGERDT